MDDDPHLKLSICRQSADVPLHEDEFRRVVACVLRAEGCRRAVLSVAVVDDAQIAALHEQHLGQAGPTDVLTFDLRGPATGQAAGLDGEIVISAQTAARVAEALGHAPQAELLLYLVHGVLHLLGYDDKEAEAAAVMGDRQQTLLKQVGYTLVAEEAVP